MSHQSDQYQKISFLHQVLIVDGLDLPHHLPRRIKANRDHALDLYPGATYKLWSGNELRSFIESEVGSDALAAFDVLQPYSYKCDLARYCLLWARGGIYSDLAIKLVNRWDIPKSQRVAAFTEMYDGMESWTATQTSLLWSEPKRPEWRHAIDVIIDNCRNKYYGPHDHYPTAGALLGRSFAKAMTISLDKGVEDEQWMGECRYVTPERPMQNVCYVAPDKRIIGMRTKLSAGDLAELELTGTNNYTQLFKARQVYGERIRSWTYDDPKVVCDSQAVKTSQGLAGVGGKSGRLCYGPFVNLSSGNYVLTVEFSNRTSSSRLRIDVAAGYGREIIIDRIVDITASGGMKTAEVAFAIDSWKESVEFRVSSLESFQGEIISFSLQEATELHWSAGDSAIQAIGGTKILNDVVAVPPRHVGRISCGPYVSLHSGSYALTTRVQAKSVQARMLVEVCIDGGNTVLASTSFLSSHAGDLDFHLEFSLDRDATDVEFRTEVFGDFEGAIAGFSLYARDHVNG